MSAAAHGERNAVRGYRWQYIQLAARVFDTLLDDSFVRLRLVDPTVGKVDDLVLVTTAGTTGHQYKSEGDPGTLTLADLLRPVRRRGKERPSLMRELADGWQALRESSGLSRVELVTNMRASVHDHLGDPGDPDRPDADHLAAFLSTVAEPLRTGTLKLTDVPVGWQPALRKIQADTGLDGGTFAQFMVALRIRVHQGNPLASVHQRRHADIRALADHLFDTVAHSADVVEFDRDRLLTELGWTNRTTLLNVHEFYVDLDRYEPLQTAIDALDGLLATTTGGYVGLLGPPGTGKSTLLTQVLAETSDRVLRYYAYVTGGGARQNRLGAYGFLHDLVFMLRRSTHAPHVGLLDPDLAQLRVELSDLLHRASAQYAEDGVRTIIVIDGLDHVETDHRGEKSLLDELPEPIELGDGVVIVIGTRTDSPVTGAIRVQLNAGRKLDLAEHRLGRNAVLAICRRAPETKDLPESIHERIAELAAGHPLSLRYLLNRVAAADNGAEIGTILEGIVVYGGDITATYEAIWPTLQREEQDIVALVTRLRIPFTIGDVADWFGLGPAGRFKSTVGYLFRFNGTSWTVFHDSFRQYVTQTTTITPDLDPADWGWDAPHHAELAQRCQSATRAVLRWEELYHRYRAGQDITGLVQQETFREQTIALRSTGAIREDLAIVLRDAAARRDLVTFTTAALAKVEFEGRLHTLEQLDLPAVYLDAGMFTEAVAFSGVDQTRQIPLSQAYDLAALLGEAGSGYGQRVYAAIEGFGFDDGDSAKLADHENDVHEAWAGAATRYRTLQHVLQVIGTFWPEADAVDDDVPRFQGRDPSLTRFHLMARQVCETLTDLARTGELDQVDRLLDVLWATINDDSDTSRRRDAILTDIALQIARARADICTDQTAADFVLREAVDLTDRHLMFDSNLYEWAHIALDLGDEERAGRLLGRRPLDSRLTRSDTSYGRNIPLTTRYQYWRAAHRLHRRRHPDRADDVLESIVPDDAEQDRYSDDNADELTGQLDRALRVLAAAAAATDEGAAYDTGRLMTDLVPLLSLGRSPTRGSATYEGIRQSAKEVLDVVVDVAAGHSIDALNRLSERLGTRFEEDPDGWLLVIRLRLAARIARYGLIPEWYRGTVAAQEVAIPDSDLDVTGRLETIGELVRHYRRLGQHEDARRLAQTLVPLAFGVGYRKDYQFDRWTDRFNDAVATGLDGAVEHSIHLARLLRLTAPMTEGAPRKAAAAMLRSLGAHHPGHGVALFEYFVRHGTMDHIEGLAELVTGLAEGISDRASIAMCVDLVTDIVAVTDVRAYPDAARAVLDACQRLDEDERVELMVAMAQRLGCYPLASTRPGRHMKQRCG
jgi:hypothetical protein